MEAKRALMIAKLDQRHKKSAPTEISTNGKESNGISHNGVDHKNLAGGDLSGDFQRQFYGELSSIVQGLDVFRNELGNSSVFNKKVDDFVNRSSKLQSLLNESTSVLSAYEIRKATSALQELQEKLKKSRSDVQPQKRFAFTNVKPTPPNPKTITTSPIPKNVQSNGSDVVDGRSNDAGVNSISSIAAAVVIQGRRNDEAVILSNADCQGKDVLILDCQSCTIRIFGIATTIHAKDLIDCTILCYPVSTSFFVERCQRSIFVAACQQLRMHTSVDCDLYLHVTTRAIVEDCQRLRFAPYADSIDDFDNVAESFEKSHLDRGSNFWDRVQDFNWLVDDQPSPNWTVLPVDQRRRFRFRID